MLFEITYSVTVVIEKLFWGVLENSTRVNYNYYIQLHVVRENSTISVRKCHVVDSELILVIQMKVVGY